MKEVSLQEPSVRNGTEKYREKIPIKRKDYVHHYRLGKSGRQVDLNGVTIALIGACDFTFYSPDFRCREFCKPENRRRCDYSGDVGV